MNTEELTEELYEYYGKQKDSMRTSAIPFFVFQILNGEMHIVILSDGLCRLFKDSRENIKSRIENHIFSEIYPEDMDAFKELWKKLLNGGTDFDIVFRKMIDKKLRTLRARGNMRVLDTGEKLYMMWFDDVTNILDDALKNDIYYDKLTGLFNMTAFGIIGENERASMKKKSIVPAFVYFDVRDMKAINEKHGFAKGNGVISGIAYVLKDVFGTSVISRFSDDHFVVLANRKGIEQKIEKVCYEVLNNPMGITVHICAGIYTDIKNDVDIYAACDRATLACKSLKGDYGIKYREFDREMFNAYHKNKHVIRNFDEALKNGYIKLYYQPIIRTVTGKICDMEALARWIDPEKGMLPPGSFISVLEDNRLINKLDFYMVRKICESLNEQKKQNVPVVPVSVNLSRINFELCDVVEEVTKIVDEHNIGHELITIEITESAFIHNQQFLESQIDRFRNAGFNVWMDDFGSEYSSLNTLQEYSFDLVKLDMRFMKNFSLTGKNRLILSDIISMISKLGVHTLAEGVQTKEQLRFLRDAGCDKVQGYLFSRPMPCEYFYNKTVLYNGLHYDDVERSDYFSKIETTGLGFPAIPDLQEGFSGDASGTPSAVMEIHDDKCKILKANNAYKQFLSDIGISDELIYGDYYEWERNIAPEFLKAVNECMETKKSVYLYGVAEGGMKIDLQLVNVAYDEKKKTGAVLVLIIKYSPDTSKD